MNLSSGTKLRKVAVAAASAGTEVLTSAIDMEGYEGVLIFVTQATYHATGNYLKAQQCTTSGGGYADLAGSKVLATADAEVLCIDIYRPGKRYVKGSVIRGGTNTATGEIYALQYDTRTRPVVNDVASVQSLVRVISPAEGTA
jgi:hypothetical protein